MMNIFPYAYMLSLEKCLRSFAYFFFFLLSFWGATPPAYGSFTPAGPIGDAPAGLCHSNTDRIPNPMTEAMDWTYILMDTSWIHFCCTTMGIPLCLFFNYFLKNCWVVWVLYIFWILTAIICKYFFFPFHRLPFHLVDYISFDEWKF